MTVELSNKIAFVLYVLSTVGFFVLSFNMRKTWRKASDSWKQSQVMLVEAREHLSQAKAAREEAVEILMDAKKLRILQ